MSREIDERIVELRFNNKDFEEGAKESIKTLDELQKSLDLDGKNALSSLSSSVKTVTERFSILEEVAKGALWSIGNDAMQAGKNLINSLSIDQISQGWGKYEEKTRAVQTIMAATGESIDEVNTYLEKLMWFTDETSYNFVDMTSNIGKFTSQGVKLDKATDAMIGIANWAAIAGQGANEASRAMYNLAQSLGSGFVKWQDWTSVQNANMDIVSFKEQVIETAKALGTLDEAGKTAKGNLVTVQSFGEYLTTDAWFTKDVLISVLNDYAAYSNEVYKIVEEQGVSASEAMAMVTDGYKAFSEQAFKAGQEAKTFSDVLDATHDAASSAWASTFEILFGNYTVAKGMWTDLANTLYDVFVEPVNGLNELLEGWDELGGREILIDALAQAGVNLLKILDLLGEAWDRAFPELTSTTLYDLTVNFNKLIHSLELTDFAYDSLADAIGGVLSLFRAASQIVIAFVKGLTGVAVTVNQIAGALVGAAGAIGRYLMAISDSIASTENLNKITQTTAAIVDLLRNGMAGLGSIALASMDTITSAFAKLNVNMKTGITGTKAFVDTMKSGFNAIFAETGAIGDFFSSLVDVIGAVARKVETFFNLMLNGIKIIHGDTSYKKFFTSILDFGNTFDGTKLGDGFKSLADGIGTVTNEFGEFMKGAENLHTKVNTALGSLLVGFRDFVDYVIFRFKELSIMDIVDATMIMGVVAFIDKLGSLFKQIGNTLKDLKNLMKPWNDMLTEVQNTLKAYQNQIKMEAFIKLATAIAILAGSLFLLSSVPIEKLAVGSVALIAFAEALTLCLKQLEGITKKKEDAERIEETAKVLLTVSAAVGLLSLAMNNIAKLDWSGIAKGLLSVTVLMTELVAAATLLGKFKVSISNKNMAGLMTLAMALTAMIAPLTLMSLLPIDKLKTGLISLGALLGELGIFVAMTANNGNMLSIGVGLTAMSGGIITLVGAIKLLSMINTNDLVTGLVSLGVLLGELTASIAVLGKFASGSGAAAMAMLPIFAAGLGLFVAVAAKLGSLDLATIAKGIIGLGAAVGILVAGAAGLSTFSSGLITFAGAVTAVNISIAILVGSFSNLLKALPLAAAGIAAFALLSEDQISKAFDNVGAAFKRLLEILAGLYGEFKTAALTLFSAIIDALGEVLPHLLNGVRVLIDEFMNFLIEYTPIFLDKLIEIINILASKAAPLVEAAVSFVLQVLIGVINGVADNIEEVADAVGGLIDAIIDLISRKLKQLWDWLYQKGQEALSFFTKGFNKGAGAETKNISNSAENMGKAAVDGLNKGIDAHSPSKATEKSGINFGKGFISGIKESIGNVANSAKGLGTSAVEGFKNGLFGQKSVVENWTTEMNEDLKEATPTMTTNSSNLGTESSNSFQDSWKGTGTNVTKNVAKEIEEDEDLEDVAKKKAENVSKAFETEFKKIDLALSKIGYEFDIWKAIQGPEADENTIKTGEIIQAQKELSEYAKQYQIAFDNYQYLVNNPDLVQSPTELAEKQGEYMRYLTQMYQKANEIAGMQKDISDQYKIGAEVALDEVFELQQAHASLIPKDFEYSDETKQAYNNFLNAVDEEAKQRYYDIWKELSSAEIEKVTGFSTINADDVKRDVWNELGLDPNNPLEGFLNVQETVANLISQTSTAYLEGLEETYPTLIGTYGDIISQGTQDVLEQAVVQYPEFQKVGEGMMEATSYGIKSNGTQVSNASVEVNNATITEMESKQPQWEEVGTGMMDGIRKGIAERRSAVIEEAVEVAIAALAAAKSALGIASPSKKFMEIGTMSVMGFAQGLSNSKEQAREASETVTNAATDPIFGFGQRVREMLEDDFDPTITPVLDISQVEQNIRRLDDMWQSTGYRVVGDISASELAREAQALASVKKEPAQVTYNESFTQNNYSPKALSAIDIYRQTNNQLMRGRVTR